MAVAYYDVELVAKKDVAEGTTEFRLSRPEGFTYQAGQYFDIILPEHAEDAPQPNWQHGFSFVSAPCEPTIGAATRMRSGSAFKTALGQVPVGAPLKIAALWGNFTLRRDTARPMVFIIGGIGITPVRSMVVQSTHDASGHKITVIYANRTRAQAAYVDELQALAGRNPNFTLVQTYTREDAHGTGIEHGHVDAEMIRRHVPDIPGAAFYMSGPRDMVYAMRDLLLDIGAGEDFVRTEEFEGY